jgi:hypothetical protein
MMTSEPRQDNGEPTVAHEKNHLGQTLHDAEAALEDQWACRHDVELLDHLRRKATTALHCLKCGKTLEWKTVGQTQHYVCPDGHGAWIDRTTLDSIPKVDH